MKFAVQIYGDFFGISPDAYKLLQEKLPFADVSFSGNSLHVGHEGSFLLVDEILSDISKLMNDKGDGKLDVIDKQEWTLTRYHVKKDSVIEKKINIDNVLDPMLL